MDVSSKILKIQNAANGIDTVRFDKNLGTLSIVLKNGEELSAKGFLKTKDLKKIGPPGSTGPSNLDGIDGKDGKDGTVGEQGCVGNKGEIGNIGQQGKQGPVGIQGYTGLKGETGNIGPTGAFGPPGIKGIKGQQGIPGLNGLNGLNGADGNDGIDGIDGNDGISGEMGDQGPKGPTGCVGPRGPAGEWGPQGPIGPTGPCCDDPYPDPPGGGGTTPPGGGGTATTTTTLAADVCVSSNGAFSISNYVKCNPDTYPEHSNHEAVTVSYFVPVDPTEIGATFSMKLTELGLGLGEPGPKQTAIRFFNEAVSITAPIHEVFSGPVSPTADVDYDTTDYPADYLYVDPAVFTTDCTRKDEHIRKFMHYGTFFRTFLSNLDIENITIPPDTTVIQIKIIPYETSLASPMPLIVARGDWHIDCGDGALTCVPKTGNSRNIYNLAPGSTLNFTAISYYQPECYDATFESYIAFYDASDNMISPAHRADIALVTCADAGIEGSSRTAGDVRLAALNQSVTVPAGAVSAYVYMHAPTTSFSPGLGPSEHAVFEWEITCDGTAPPPPGSFTFDMTICDSYVDKPTIADAAAYAEAEFGIYAIDWDVHGTVAWANAVNRAWCVLLGNYPSLKQLIADSSLPMVTTFVNNPPDSDGYTFGSFAPPNLDDPPADRYMIIMYNAHKSESETVTTIQGLATDGFCCSGNKYFLTIHEFGHFCHYNNTSSTNWATMAAGYGTTHPHDKLASNAALKNTIEGELSDYAAFFYPIEFGAEYFCAMILREQLHGQSYAEPTLSSEYDANHGYRPPELST